VKTEGIPDRAGRHRPGLKAVLFDMDGLLVDSEPLWFEVEQEVMDRLGVPWEPADQRALIGGSLARSLDYMLAKAAAHNGSRPAPLPGRAQVAGWLLAGMTRRIRARGVALLPGAAGLLAEVAAARIPYGLVTSAERQIMNAVLAATGMSFPVTVCADDVRHAKPDPEPYLRAAALLGVAPAGCVALEDSPNGIASAEAAGCAVVVVPSLPVPLPPRRPGPARRVTVGSLREVSLATLRALAAGASGNVCDHEGGAATASGGR
jgi:HAD superfamily hydrolase (TIGR01509 family)